ncbi:MAG: glycine cleavage T C-terminal barrel domain-containing protein [Chthoniobacterales bacterium]
MDTLISMFFDLSARTKYRITGVDRLRFLNGQITNDLRRSSAASAMQASVLNVKGKLNAHVYIRETGEGFFIDADAALRESLSARLERYIIADDVQLEDVTVEWSLFHLLVEAQVDLPNEWSVTAANRFGQSGWDIWVESSAHQSAVQQLSERLSFCNEDCAERLRIEQGVPRWGHELTEEIIPVEANLEAQAIDYAKGCYIGQEVISRMKMSGQTNKRLCGLTSVAGAPLRVQMRLSPENDEKDVGVITSTTESRRLEKYIALGYVKRGFNSIGTRLRARAGSEPVATQVQIVTLPFT